MALSEKRRLYMQEYRRKNAEKLRKYNKAYMMEWVVGVRRVRKSSAEGYFNSRKCYSCLRILPIENYYRSKGKPGGRMYMCKDCNKTRCAERARVKRLLEAGWEKSRQSKFPEKRKARECLKEAVSVGKIKKLPCEMCGVTDNVHGHHEDYGKPLEVRWLCSQHHADRHREMREVV